MLFGLCATVSLLVHELGHAFVARHYQLTPPVLLHGIDPAAEADVSSIEQTLLQGKLGDLELGVRARD